RIALDVEAVLDEVPAAAQAAEEILPDERIAEQGLDVAPPGLEDGIVRGDAFEREQRGLYAHARRIARVRALGHGAVVREQRAGPGCADAERHAHLVLVEPEQLRARRGSRGRTVYAGRMKRPRLGLARSHRDPLLNFPAH